MPEDRASQHQEARLCRPTRSPATLPVPEVERCQSETGRPWRAARCVQRWSFISSQQPDGGHAPLGTDSAKPWF